MKKVFTFLMLTALFAPLALNAQRDIVEQKNIDLSSVQKISRSELASFAQPQQNQQTVGNTEQKASSTPLIMNAQVGLVQTKDVDLSLMPSYSLSDFIHFAQQQQSQQTIANNELMAYDTPMTRSTQITLLDEDFESMSSFATTYSATDWFAYNAGNGNNWDLFSNYNYAHGGSNSAYYQYHTSGSWLNPTYADCYMVSEPFTVSADMTNLTVSLWERVYSSSGETFEVFFVKASDVTSAAAVASATKYNAINSASYTNTTYAQKTGSVTYSALAGQSVRVVVHCTSARNRGYLFIDDITVTETISSDCPYPTGLTVSNVTNNSATIAWGEDDGTDYQLEYGILSGTPTLTNGSWLKYDNGTMTSYLGDDTEYDWTWAAMYPASMLNGKNMLSKISIYEYATYDVNDFRVDIYSGGTTAPGTLLYSQTFSPSGSTGFHEVTLAKPVAIDPSQNLWISLTTTGTYVIPMCNSTETNNKWVEVNEWINIGDVSSLSGYGWMIRGYLQEYDYSSVNWTPLGTQSSPYELTNLAPETTYAVRVRANCGSDGYSPWVANSFTTLSNCAEPFDLSVTDITSSSATLSWSGVQDVYNVSCKKVLFYEDFEGGAMPNGWTTINNDGDSYDWTYSAASHAHSGTGVMTSASSVGSNNTGWNDFTPDNWLVTPLLDLQGTMSVWVRSQQASVNDGYYQENFAIYISTTGTNVSDFSILVPENVTTTEYVEYTADLSSYAGQQGYIAIRHFNCEGQFRMNVDDFGIYDDIHTATVNGNTITVDNLLPGTTYTWQVQGANCDGNGTTTDWSSTANFRTLPDCGIADLPYICGFETEEEYECVTLIGSDFSLSSTQARTGNYCYRFNGLDDDNRQYIYFPEFSGESPMELSFYYRIADAERDQFFYVGWGDDLSNMSWGHIEIAANTDYLEYTESFPRGTKFVAIAIYGRSSTSAHQSYFLLDDININGGCVKPKGLEADNITTKTADVSWGDYADEYNVRYRTVRIVSAELQGSPFTDDFESGNLDNWRVANQLDTSTETDWSVRSIMGVDPHAGSYFASSRSFDGDDNDFDVDNWLITPQMTMGNVVEFYLKEDYPVWLDDVNVLFSKDGLTFVSLAEPVVTSAEWQKVTVDLGQYAGQVGYIAILHQDHGKDYVAIDDFRIDDYLYTYEYGEWQTITSRSNDATLPGLVPETMYEVQVQSSCGSEGTSDWSPAITFTTPSGCTAPIDLTADDITPYSATLSWSDYQENYDVRYRGRVFYEGFDRGIPSTWTTIDADGDGYNWEQYRFGIDNTTCAGSASYLVGGVGALTPNNWLISPQIDLGGFLEVWVKGQDSHTYDEYYTIYVSTSGKEIADFTELTHGTTTNVYQKVIVDLGSYDGQQGYIAIRHHNCTNKNYFCVDDFGVYKTNDWSTANPEEATLSVSGLLFNTEYVWQVKGEDCTDWSAPAVFTTLEGYIKHIEGHNGNAGYYYLIASPIGEVEPEKVTILPDGATNMVSGNFDLYYFDQAKELEWITYKEGGAVNEDPGFNLVTGKGYLYANSETVDLVFAGHAYTGSGDVALTTTGEATGLDFPTWNLVGNPFAKTAYIDRDFYVMNTDGNEIITPNRPEDGIQAMEGCFIVATQEEETLTFSTTAPTTGGGSKVVLNLSQDHKVIDRAIVRFGQGRKLPKIQLNPNHTKVSMTMDGNDYAVVSTEEQGEMPVRFRAEKNGNYTLSVNSEDVSFAYLHLIDNLTGADVDLLETPSYSFEARTTDYSSRFKLVFATGNNESDTFAFFSNGSFVINNDGAATLQVIDVTGRILSSESFNGCTNVNVNAAPGVYMLRLINGDNVKVQKVVVK